MKNLTNYLKSFPSRSFIGALNIYQKTFSPDHGAWGFFLVGPVCRFYPSCSEYAKESLRQYGLLKGLMLSSRRVLRCHPWNEGGYDPIK